jgi:hypothetical protein
MASHPKTQWLKTIMYIKLPSSERQVGQDTMERALL